MSSENPISRRDLVTHLGAGIAGAAITVAVPNAQAQTRERGIRPRHLSTRHQNIQSRHIRDNRNRGQVSPVR